MCSVGGVDKAGCVSKHACSVKYEKGDSLVESSGCVQEVLKMLIPIHAKSLTLLSKHCPQCAIKALN